MYRAGRFTGEEEFRGACRRAIRHSIQSFLKSGT
jgi:hypothetical protein